MKTLIVKETMYGRTAQLIARTTYQTHYGNWIAEVDEAEFRHACLDLCQGIDGCTCDDLRVEADQDDDGKEYKILSS